MHDVEALRILTALAQSTRFRIVDLLAREAGVGMPSGDIADQVGVPRNLMSSHLAILTKAGLVESRKEGRTVVYVLRVAAFAALRDRLAALIDMSDHRAG